MKKTKTKRPILDRATVRRLTRDDLKPVVAGKPKDTGCISDLEPCMTK